MIIGSPKEVKESEARVSLNPVGVRELVARGHSVIVEQGAGEGSFFVDEAYVTAGARIVPTAEDVFAEAELIVKVKEPTLVEASLLGAGHVLFTYLHLAALPATATALQDSGATCIAYETVELADGYLPLLAPMSEIAGKMAVQAGAHWLEGSRGGKGVLMGGAAGVLPANVVVLGAGVAGRNSASVASGMGARVTVLDIDIGKLRALEDQAFRRVDTAFSSIQTIEDAVLGADLVIGAVLVAGGKAPVVVGADLVREISNGTVLVDISIDQGGCFATSRQTTHDDPVYVVDGVLHYAVGNIPGAVPRTSTVALTNATLRYVLALAEGIDAALSAFPELISGINVAGGEITHAVMGSSLGMPVRTVSDVLGIGTTA